MPAPFTCGYGSPQAITTRRTPAATSASAQGERLAMMRTGLERHIGRGAPRRLARHRQRDPLGMRPAADRGRAAPDHPPVADQHAADGRVGPGAAEPAPRQRERRPHVLDVVHRPEALSALFERAQEVLEVPRLAEVAVDAGEADVSDGVHLLQRLHHQLADILARHLALTGRFKLADEAIHDALDPLVLDRALAQGDADGAGELVSVEQDASPVRLDHGEFAQLHPFDGGEALPAIAAEAAPADGRAVIGGATVFDLRVLVAAKRAAHQCPRRAP